MDHVGQKLPAKCRKKDTRAKLLQAREGQHSFEKLAALYDGRQVFGVLFDWFARSFSVRGRFVLKQTLHLIFEITLRIILQIKKYKF